MTDVVCCDRCGASCASGQRFCAECGAGLAGLPVGCDTMIGAELPGGIVVRELIDVGGMGRVYRAEQALLGRTVAVKIIHPHLLGDATIEARFLTEARAASRLNHPHSVAVIDFGKFDGRFYLVMEHLRGTDLADVVAHEAPLAPERAVEIAAQILEALDEAHHLGIIHRDLKPENVVLEPSRTGGDFVKVLDFGLAKVREVASGAHSDEGDTEGDPRRRRMTTPGTICGTPEYMAPEQARGEGIDHRADLYACGVLLFELLTGRLPFNADSPNELAILHIVEPAPDPRRFVPARALPDELVNVLLRALAKQPSARHETAREMAAALRASVAPGQPARKKDEPSATCATCGAFNAPTQRFCGDCGNTLAPGRPSPLPATPPSAAEPPEVPFVARERELAWLLELRAASTGELTAACIVAPLGHGKTRLLTAFARHADEQGDLVVSIAPDPWHAQVACYALRQAVMKLAGIESAEELGASARGRTAHERAGLALLFGGPRQTVPPSGRRWTDKPPSSRLPTEQRDVLAAALRWALNVASRRIIHGRVVLLIDDVDLVDGASRNAFADLLASPTEMPALLIGASNPGSEPEWPTAGRLVLDGIPCDVGSELLRTHTTPTSRSSAPSLAARGPKRVSPLHVFELVRFRQEGGKAAPEAVLDLIALRIQRLGSPARQTLQALAVLGDEARASEVAALLPDVTDVDSELLALRRRGMVHLDRGAHRVAHPLVREVALSSIPRATRQQLHSLARRGAEDAATLPREAQALHAVRAGDSFDALMLLERLAEEAGARGDADGRVHALRLAVGVAVDELSRGNLDEPETALLLFSGKLGDALCHAGRSHEAVGVLREALGAAPPNAIERARLLASLARASRQEGELETSRRHLDEALRLSCTQSGSVLFESLVALRQSWST